MGMNEYKRQHGGTEGPGSESTVWAGPFMLHVLASFLPQSTHVQLVNGCLCPCVGPVTDWRPIQVCPAPRPMVAAIGSTVRRIRRREWMERCTFYLLFVVLVLYFTSECCISLEEPTS